MISVKNNDAHINNVIENSRELVEDCLDDASKELHDAHKLAQNNLGDLSTANKIIEILFNIEMVKNEFLQ